MFTVGVDLVVPVGVPTAAEYFAFEPSMVVQRVQVSNEPPGRVAILLVDGLPWH